MKNSGNRIAFCGNDAIMDWVCQKVSRLCSPILLPAIYVQVLTMSLFPAIFNNYFRVLLQIMMLVVALFACLIVVSSARQVCTYIEDDTWVQVDIELR